MSDDLSKDKEWMRGIKLNYPAPGVEKFEFTDEELAKLEITRQRIREIEKKALERLRNPKRRRKRTMGGGE